MNFKIDWVENKTSAKGTAYKRATLTDESGKQTEGVAIFSFFKGFEDVTPGNMVAGTLESALYNGKMSYTLKDEVTFNSFKGGANRGSGIAKAQERKAEFIEKAQDNKELGIKVSSTMRMAVDLAIAELKDTKDILESSMQLRIKFWRQWLWSEWDKTDSDFPPF